MYGAHPIIPEVAAEVEEYVRVKLDLLQRRWSLDDAAARTVELWEEISVKDEISIKRKKVAVVARLGDAMMKKAGSHVECARALRAAYRKRHGEHLSADRIDSIPGLSDEVRARCKAMAQEGVTAKELKPRWNLRHKMDPKVAAEHGMEAVDKMIKDGIWGRVLLMTTAVRRELLDDRDKVMLCKLIRVAKRNLQGYEIAGEGRFCHAQIEANELTPSDGVGVGGKVRLPVIKDVLADVSYFAAMYPGLEILASKADVSSAFKLLWLAVELCGLYACAIPQDVLGLGLGDFIVIQLTLTFGSSISPGSYDFFSKAIEMGHRAHSPPVPRRDGVSRFRSNTLVDDGVIVAVKLGASMRFSLATYLWNMRMALGPQAVNLEKAREEGMFLARQIVWGIGMDLSRAHVNIFDVSLWLTQSKQEKARGLVFSPLFDWGSFAFGKWQAQVLAGNVVFWGNVCPPMWAVLLRITAARRDLPDGKAGPTAAPTTEELAAYRLTWQAVELLRVIVGRPEWWKSTVTASFASVLTLRERLAMRGAEESVVWCGGDANLHGCAMGSWTDGCFDVISIEDWKPRLEEWMADSCPGFDDKTFVAVWELLCFVAVATHCAPRWAGKVVIYVTDNQNVEAWLSNLKAGSPVANHMCLLVSLLTCRFKFNLYSFYINTDLNPWDRPSRIFDPPAERKADGFGVEGLPAFMSEVFPGLARVDMAQSLSYYLSGGMRGLLELFGQEDAIARSLAEQRVLNSARQGSCAGLVAVDLLAGSGTCSVHFQHKGGVIRAMVEWHPAARAIYRLAVGAVPHVTDFWSDDISAVPGDDVTVAFATPNCQSYSEASGNPRGLNDARGWMLPDVPFKLAVFAWLLASLVENVWGALLAHGGQAWELYTSGMASIDHYVWPAERVLAPEVGSRVSSTRLIAQSERRLMASELCQLPSIAAPGMRPMHLIREALLPVEEVRKRLWECIIEVDHRTIKWADRVVTGTRRPTTLGTVTFTGRGAAGFPVRGALVTMKGGRGVDTGQRWRVQAVYRDRRLELWAPGRLTVVHPDKVDVHPFEAHILSIASVGNRPTVIGERPGGPGKGWYWDDRFSPPVLRALLGEETCLAVGKPLSLLKAWESRAREEASEPKLPRTVPPYEEKLKFMLAGNAVESCMSEIAIDRLGSRVAEFERLIEIGKVERPAPMGGSARAYSAEVAAWRASVLASARDARPTNNYGIDDSHLELTVAAKAEATDGDWERQVQAAVGSDSTRDDSLEMFSVCPPIPILARGGGVPPRDPVGGSSDGAPAQPRRGTRVRKKNEILTAKHGGRWTGVPDGADRRLRSSAASEESERASDVTSRSYASSARVKRRSTPNRTTGRRRGGVIELRRGSSASGAERAVPADRVRTSGRRAKPLRQAASRRSAAVPPTRRVAPRQLQRPSRKVGPKVRKRDGFGLVGLEARAALERDDWAAFEHLVTEKLPLHSVAWGTLSSYEPGWRQWVSFCMIRGFSPFLDVGTASEKREASRRLLLFVGICAFGMGERASTVKGKLMAIRFFHLVFDMENPIDKVPRVWMGYRAIKRWELPTERKHPVTPDMVDDMDEQQRGQGLDGVIKRAARYFALYLCCRASEYLAPVDADKIVMVSNVQPMAGRRYTDWGDPAVDGFMAKFRGSKTDQYNEGSLRYVGKTRNARCAVKAFVEWQRMDPEHFERADRPMFCMSNGRVFTREEMQHDLRDAAVRCEIDEQRFGTHSWRVSGATWMYQAGYDIETIKRHGRWTSNVVHVYLWEGSGHSGLAAKMADVDFVVHAQMPKGG